MPIVFLFLLALILVPFLFVFGFFNLISAGLRNLGLSPEITLVVFGLAIVGSFINIPLGRRKTMVVERKRFFGLFSSRELVATGVSLNAGGGLIPLLIAVYLLLKVPLIPALSATFFMIILSFALSRFVPSKGIVLPLLIPPLVAAILAMVISFEYAAPIAFISGVLGILIGADILKLLFLSREKRGMLSIGGAGVFDGIFLVGIISAFLAGLSVR